MRLKRLILVVFLVAAFIPLVPATQAQDNYEQLVRRALSELGTNCANLEPNSVCYGFAKVQGTFSETTSFAAPGDRAPLTKLTDLQTSAINLSDQTWGIAALHVQANVPGGLTNQSAIYTLLGEVGIQDAVSANAVFIPVPPVAVTTVTETKILDGAGKDAFVLGTVASGTLLQADGVSPDNNWVRVMYQEKTAWVSRESLDPGASLSSLPVIRHDSMTPMQAFTFKTGGSTPPSLIVPPHVLIVQSPKNTPVDIVANGAPIRVLGTIFLRTLPDGRNELITADGEATLYPDNANKVKVVAGTAVVFGGDTWSGWRVVSQGEWDGYKYIEKITIFTTITLPGPITPSGIGQPITIVVGKTIIIPHEPHYIPPVLAPYEYGKPGQDLERLAWEPITIGCGACDPKMVLYHSDATGSWDIYRLNDTGTDELSNNISRGGNSQNVQPSYSADNKWVAFTSNRDIVGGWEVYLGAVDGSKQVRLTYNSGNDVNPVWGPANLLAWESNRTGNWDIFMTDVSGDAQPVNLTNDPSNDINPFWFSDGGCDSKGADQRLVFQSDRTGTWEIYMLDVATKELTQLTNDKTENQVPIVSHDGSKMAWVKLNDSGVYDLWIMDLATKEAHKLVELGTDVAGHTFSVDGSLIAFHASVNDEYDVFAVDTATNQIKNLTDNTFEDRAPTFLCENTKVIYHSDQDAKEDNPGQRSLFEINPLPLDTPSAAPQRLTVQANADDIYPVASPHEEINSKEGRVPAHP